ncbi:MAG: citrate transporter [Clostridiales bacterium]|nr:citrate transporter [Clostridiales bacterium]
MSQKIRNFLKKEAVLCISLLLAVLSMIFVPLDRQYANYIDFHTLSILLSLMLIMAGLRDLGLFSTIGSRMLDRTSNVRSLSIVLVLLCFVFSMFITNDVSLIAFVPFTIDVLIMAGLEKYMIRIIVLQTVAANLGSMLTPIGNPQNLYLFSKSRMSPAGFVSLMLPYTLLSFAGLLAACFILIDRRDVSVKTQAPKTLLSAEKRKAVIYILLFLFALTSVARLISVYIVMAVVLAAVLALDRKTLLKADYALLFTFVFLFIFIGNMKRIPQISLWLGSIIQGHELLTSVLSSQVISNVPAAILLSGFTDNTSALIVGTNLGGLGTIIASMASLISFKYYGKTAGKRNAAYLGVFTLLNLIFLEALLLYTILAGAVYE